MQVIYACQQFFFFSWHPLKEKPSIALDCPGPGANLTESQHNMQLTALQKACLGQAEERSL